MGRAHRLLLGLLLLGMQASLAAAQTGSAAVLLRVFLTDGTALVSYGEWARVADRLVFSVPLDPRADVPDLHLLSLPLSHIDWPRTEQYAAAARAAHYAATRGEADFALFSAEVARVLNEVALLPDPATRLATAERARRALAEYPRHHFGYRAGDVREMLALLDEVISELRVAAGQDRFDLTLVAEGPAVPNVTLLPSPTEREIAEHLLVASRLASTPAERQSLLQTLIGLLDRSVDLLPSGVSTALRREATRRLSEEQRLDGAYAALRHSALIEAHRHASHADVRGLERLRSSVARDDERLGRQRPDTMIALYATLDLHLDAARRLRLARDQWRSQVDRHRAYRRSVLPTLEALRRAQGRLEDVRAQAGPDLRVLRSLESRLDAEGRRVAAVSPPPSLEPLHAMLRSACDLALNAVRLRLAAVSAGDLVQAGHASAAAAGSLMLIARVRSDLDASLRAPTLP
jgi:hypothetical protein